MNKHQWLRPVLWWVFAAVPITLILVAAYAIVQQDYRESLNDPQIQMAEDAGMAIQSGAVPADIVPHGTPPVDIANSLSPWIAVYDSSGKVLEASGQLDGAPPTLPQGVFDTSTWSYPVIGHHWNGSPVDQNRFTWQPDPQVRQAVILVYIPSKNEYVASGRNMREVEQRIEHEGEIIFVAWVFTLAATFIWSFIVWWVLKRF
jgi:hypothetical protein